MKGASGHVKHKQQLNIKRTCERPNS